MSDLETYLRESRRVFSLCPDCNSVWRLSELVLSPDGSYTPDWKDVIDGETAKLRKEQADLQATEKAARTEAFRRAQKERIPVLLERTAPTFVKQGIDPRDIRTLVDPTEFIEFRGYAADQEIEAVRFLHLGTPTPVHASISRALADGSLGWKTAQVGDDGTVTLEEPTERVKRKSGRDRAT